MKVAKLREKAEKAAAETPEAVSARLAQVIAGRIDHAGSILAEVQDHVKRGEVTAAEVGALSEVIASVAEAVSAAAFHLRVNHPEQEVSQAPALLVPETGLVLPG